MKFDRVIIADWSASGALSPQRPSANAIWVGIADHQGARTQYFRGRALAESFLQSQITNTKDRILLGFDFPMGYPKGFAARLTQQAHARSVWGWLHHHLTDLPDNTNNRFDIAARINALFDGAGPFWGRPRSLPLADLPERKLADYAQLGIAERRLVEQQVPKAQPVWKLYTTGAAGSQGLVGQAMIHRLAQLPDTAVWPFDPPDARVVLAEVYPSLLAQKVAADPASIKDEAQVRLLSQALWHLSQAGGLDPLLKTPPAPVTTEEGWILGAGFEHLLAVSAP
jgi:hypothetical protein